MAVGVVDTANAFNMVEDRANWLDHVHFTEQGP
jgi:hypothetical protein